MEFLALTKVGGILGPFAYILGMIMNWLFILTSKLGIMNIGLCIILFTIVTKILMFPLTIKQQKSTKLMSIIQPEISAIQAKYKGKKDQESIMKQNAETSAVYEKYGTSMTGGCLQLVIQLPILLALYQVIYHIPAYVISVKVVIQEVLTAIQAIGGDYVAMLKQFAAANEISLAGLGELATDNRVIDFLYKLNPSQWEGLKNVFPSISNIIGENADRLGSMNSFLGLSLAATPYNGQFIPSAAWLIPILAGLSQWFSAKLMTSSQSSAANQDNPMASSMKMMNTVMPLMSVVFCFTFPIGIGIYWVSSSVVQIIQQLIVNHYMNKIDVDEMIKQNLEKANRKRAKKGLPPMKVTQNATANLKNIQASTEKEESMREEKIKKSHQQIKDSTSYYNQNAKPGSLASKANMVRMYNEKNEKHSK